MKKRTGLLLIVILALVWFAVLRRGREENFPPPQETKARETESQEEESRETDDWETADNAHEPEETADGENRHARGEEESIEMPPDESEEAADGLNETNMYAYQLMTDEEKRLYREMYKAVTGFMKDAELSTRRRELLDPVFSGMMADHPEIFYVDGYSFVTHTLGGQLQKITFTGKYTMSSAQAQQKQRQIDACVRSIFSRAPERGDDYGLLLYFFNTVIEQTDYNLNAPENQTICSVFLNGQSVCKGYAKAFQYLCQKAGIPAFQVSGTVESGGSHAWDLVYADGAWYYVDPTWGDVQYRNRNGSMETKDTGISYDYFCVTTEQLLRTHRPDNTVTLPICTATRDNYYIREKMCFGTYDERAIEKLFSDAYAKGKQSVTLKCTDEAVYRTFRRKLIEEQEIFRFLRSSGSSKTVSYSESVQQLSFTFWL